MRLFVKYVLFTSLLAFSVAGVAQDWKLVKTGKGVQVYNKEVPGSRYKEFRGVTVIEAELRDIAYLFFTDYAYKDWLANIVESKRVSEMGVDGQYIYLVQKLPLVKWRDVVVHGKLSQDPASKVLTVSVTHAPGFVEPNDKYVRVKRLVSEFTFTPLDGKKVEVVYEMDVDPGGKIPTLLANAFTTKTPYKTLRNLKQISGSLEQYRSKEIANPYENVE